MLLGISVCEFGVSLKLVGAQNDYSPRNLFRISFLTTQFIFINFPLLARPSATHTHTYRCTQTDKLKVEARVQKSSLTNDVRAETIISNFISTKLGGVSLAFVVLVAATDG